ncbi:MULTISPECIES: Flp family type IVb pilin [unclassified Nocardioides]|uniref:Flp family type IVb pilin n=1 Tax=unclassified Nocardioides TaxID=2615069 RepID=UPI000056F261|nr:MULTISPECIES: Flp family type IVb pilin [unclassified Nocardioides]ABL82623.1 Flp/Fap pilin component [Nocardioides sp. JS614]
MLQYLQILLAGHRARMDERGASAVEYGLLIGGIAAVIVVLVFALGDQVKELFTDTCTSVEAKTTAQC